MIMLLLVAILGRDGNTGVAAKYTLTPSHNIIL